MKYLFVFLIFFIASNSYSQYSIRISLKTSEGNQPLEGATARIITLQKIQASDSLGKIVFSDLPPGKYLVTISYVGFQQTSVSITLPQENEAEVLLTEEEEDEEEVIVNATRTSRLIRDIPTRVEIISGEELGEKANMKPGDIRMLLSESTGIQTQQTSATSYNSSIRIQGLDGRYTQLLRDGFPLYAGFSGGLSIMQIAPLDLKQVEVIKGAASTLYGGGAIAGLVNLVSKTPGEKRELNFLANGTSARGLDLSGFYSQRFEKIGLTIFGSSNGGKAYDPADIGLTAIPKFSRYTIHPRIFFYGEKTDLNIGLNYVWEDRLGGSMGYINNGSQGYFEKNETRRFTTQFDLRRKIGKNASINIRNSYSTLDRSITIPAYAFEAVQQSSYSEINFTTGDERSFWIAGVNYLTDDLQEKRNTFTPRDYHINTLGLFVQNSWKPTENFSLETGLRGDQVNEFGFELLPRISAMFKLKNQITLRIGGGFGYKAPTVFNEESEKIQFQNILPIDQLRVKNERSAGGNFDLNYRTNIGGVGFTINQLFFYTQLDRPLVLSYSGSTAQFVNADGHIDTRGLETNLRFTYHDFKLFVGYTYADVKSHFKDEKLWFPLTPRHRVNNVLMYEQEDKWKLGLEGYYFSKQKLSDGSFGRSYWILGFMAEKIWEKISVYINFENFTDTRQTRFDNIFSGPINNPVFRDIYAPVDGFVVNGGIKIRL